MSGRAPRQKGNRFEAFIVDLLRAAGIESRRIPLSGAMGGEWGGDIKLTVRGENWTGECKSRANGFSSLYAWIDRHKLLFVKRDRSEPLVIMRMADFVALVGAKPEPEVGGDG